MMPYEALLQVLVTDCLLWSMFGGHHLKNYSYMQVTSLKRH